MAVNEECCLLACDILQLNRDLPKLQKKNPCCSVFSTQYCSTLITQAAGSSNVMTNFYHVTLLHMAEDISLRFASQRAVPSFLFLTMIFFICLVHFCNSLLRLLDVCSIVKFELCWCILTVYFTLRIFHQSRNCCCLCFF